jgi:aldehyde:ferredoxin oxidoreductase
VDVEAVSYLNHLCYELGLDPIEMGNAIAMLAEATERGLVENGVSWGDAERFVALTQQTGMQEGEWRRLGDGAAGMARSLGLEPLAMAVKGISIQNVDPRSEPAWGLLNATESLGAAAHIWTYGDLVRAMHEVGVEPVIMPESTPAEIAGHVKQKQDLVAALDAMTVCAFSSYAFDAEDYAAALGFVTHTSWSPTGLLAAGARIFDLERQYNAELRLRCQGRHPPRALPPGAGPDRTARRQGVRSGPHARRLLRAAGLAGGRARRGSPAGLRHHPGHPVKAE